MGTVDAVDGHVRWPLQAFAALLAMLALVALGCWLQLRQADRAGVQAVSVDVVRGGTLLGLQLFPLLELGVVPQMRGDAGVDVVLPGVVVLDQPGRAIPGLSSDRLLDEGAQHGFGEDSTVAADVFVGKHGLRVGIRLAHNEVSRDRLRAGAVGEYPWPKRRLVPDKPMDPLPAIDSDRHFLSRIVVVLEFIKDHVDKVIQARDGLKLNLAQDGAFQRLRERGFNLATASELRMRVSGMRRLGIEHVLNVRKSGLVERTSLL